MAGFCEGGNEHPGSLKASLQRKNQGELSWAIALVMQWVPSSYLSLPIGDVEMWLHSKSGVHQSSVVPSHLHEQWHCVLKVSCSVQLLRVSVSVRVSVVSGMSDDDDDEDEEGRRGNPVPVRSLLLWNSTKGAARLNVPIRRTNHYQQ
ncbi:hypothetical protein ANN_09933 [Periplaneta americana]|uniref:Uncharacterized protein n=1 Tax=Periplaneta americana TaxID=6978 RepID=A0ABQ8TMN4_PERAM|nr:hypothetical protein ANN_09933 [Periplaneta americana]